MNISREVMSQTENKFHKSYISRRSVYFLCFYPIPAYLYRCVRNLLLLNGLTNFDEIFTLYLRGLLDPHEDKIDMPEYKNTNFDENQELQDTETTNSDELNYHEVAPTQNITYKYIQFTIRRACLPLPFTVSAI